MALANTVIDVFQKGYRLRDRMLRAARVVVAARPADEEKDPLETERRELRWLRENVPGGFVEWSEVSHPDFPDRTVEVAREIGVHHILRLPTNKGLATAFLEGVRHCVELGADLIVNIDGELIHRDQAGISPFDSSVQGGDGVWEGLRVYDGRIFELDAWRQLLAIPQCIGAKHSSLSRALEWERLALRDALRPGNDTARMARRCTQSSARSGRNVGFSDQPPGIRR